MIIFSDHQGDDRPRNLHGDNHLVGLDIGIIRRDKLPTGQIYISADNGDGDRTEKKQKTTLKIFFFWPGSAAWKILPDNLVSPGSFGAWTWRSMDIIY